MEKVYESIRKVMATLKSSGIAKAHRNKQQGFNYRGIDDIHNQLAPALVDAGLLMLPRVIERTCIERQTKAESALYFVILRVEYDLISTEDGSKYTVSVIGEAMDTADKATNKALSVAYKIAAIQIFSIPVVGDDADAEDADVAPSVWTADQKAEAEEAARGGVNAYGAWWRAQTQEFRESAISTKEHVAFKAAAAKKSEAS